MILKLLWFFVGAYLLYAGVFFFGQRRLMYPGTYLFGAAPEDPTGPGVATAWLELPFGSVEARFLAPAPSAPVPAPAIIFAHGNGELIDHWDEMMASFTERGVGVMLVEFPGYGQSDGRPSQRSIVAAFEAGADWLADRDDIDGDRIVAMGRSIGGGAAAALTETRSMAALVLMSTFTSVRTIAWRNFYLPPFLALDPYDNRAAVAAFDGPVLVIHGRSDDQLPYEHGVELAAASPRAELMTLDCAHNDCPPSWPEFVDAVMAFLEREGVLGEGSGA